MRTKKYYKLQKKNIYSGVDRIQTCSAKSNRLWLEECMILRYFQPISNHRFDTVYSVITVCPDSSTSAQPQNFCDTSGTRTQDPNIKDW